MARTLRSSTAASLLALAVVLTAAVVLAEELEKRQFGSFCPPGYWRDQFNNCRTSDGRYVQFVPVNNNNNNGFNGNNGLQRASGNNSPRQFFNGRGGGYLNPFRGRQNMPRLNIDWHMAKEIRIAHGVMACLAFVVFFPIGAILVRLLPGRLAVAAHAGFQILGFLFYIVATALGIWMATNIRWRNFDLVHDILIPRASF